MSIRTPPPTPNKAASPTLLFSVAMLFLLSVLTVNGGAISTAYADVDFVAADTNDPPGTADPGYTKDVASCIATLVSDELVAITIDNAYPSYTCTLTVTVQNSGLLDIKLNPLEIDAPPVLTVVDLSNDAGIELGGGDRVTEKFSVHTEQPAVQGAAYTFEIRKPFRLFHRGTIGFWRAWEKHNTFTEDQIEGWLSDVDASSKWLGPTTVEGMVSLMQAALKGSAKPRDRFLAHYLATRLNEASGILDGVDVHDVTGADPGNYLGLADPSAATLDQLIAAIEGKYGTPVNNSRYNTMKNVCDNLNNLEI